LRSVHLKEKEKGKPELGEKGEIKNSHTEGTRFDPQKKRGHNIKRERFHGGLCW